VTLPTIDDPLFQEAVSAIDAGDVSTLERLLAAHPGLVNVRADYGEGYFRNPYLLWFVAENPIRNGTLPANIVQVARVIVQKLEDSRSAGLREQLDQALGLVCSGRVVRESGVQAPLIDLLVEAGATPDAALLPALAHGEVAAAERLLQRGAILTLTAAVCTGRTADVARLIRVASAGERQLALTAAAFYGQARTVAQLVECPVDLDGYSPAGFHPHGTPLHQAVFSGSLDTVKVLVGAGAELHTKDRIHQGTPLGWADHLQQGAIADYLRGIVAAGRADEGARMSNGTLAGPAAVGVECIIPILRVGRLSSSIPYYVDVLGFQVDWGGEDGAEMASVSRDGRAIMLCQGSQGQAGTWIWIGVEDIEPLFEVYKSRGVKFVQEPTNYAWAYEMRVEDPDGHVLRFGSEPKLPYPRSG
jgi:ankyrin repeat protein